MFRALHGCSLLMKESEARIDASPEVRTIATGAYPAFCFVARVLALVPHLLNDFAFSADKKRLALARNVRLSDVVLITEV